MKKLADDQVLKLHLRLTAADFRELSEVLESLPVGALKDFKCREVSLFAVEAADKSEGTDVSGVDVECADFDDVHDGFPILIIMCFL